MSISTLVDYIADSAARLDGASLDERDLDRLDFARRCLDRAAKTTRARLRARTAVTGEQCEAIVQSARRDAIRALAGTPWEPTTCLHGATGVLFMARHRRDGVTITVQARSLRGLQRGVDAIDVGSHAEARAA